MKTIFTLDARGNVMLEVIKDYFKLDNCVMHKEIKNMHLDVQNILEDKGIEYIKLKKALVPSIDRNEAGFIFDSNLIESSWYGNVVEKAILPLLDIRTTQSVLCGDLLGDDQEFISEILSDSMVVCRPYEFIHGSSLYCVYINNLSDSALQNLHTQLQSFKPYIGYIPCTYQTIGKTYLSTILVNAYLKHKNIIIMGHEDDRSNSEDVNLVGYPFEEYGFSFCSLQSNYFDLFLSYKIERVVIPGFEVDTEMSLNSLTKILVPLHECRVRIDEDKFQYLIAEKLGKLQKAGISAISRDELEIFIKEKISSSYIYNLTFLEEHNVIKFNILIEVLREKEGYPTKLVIALEYLPEEGTIRLITLH